MAPRCSIIIPVYNRADLTRQCLNRIFMLSGEEANDVEVIVVDDGSSDITAEYLAAYGDAITVVTHASNMGFATACNDGAALASSDYILFLNNDTLPEPHWLDALMRCADEHHGAAVVGAKLVYPTGMVQHAGVVIGQHCFPHHIYAGFPQEHHAVNVTRRFQAVTGAALLARRDQFNEVGGFDPAFVNGYEDIDLCLRLGQRGQDIYYCHESVLVHLESVTEGRFDELEANLELFRRRWGDRVRPDDVQYYLDDGLLNIHYSPLYPQSISVARELAVVDESGDAGDRLLAERARQVAKLLRENIHLKVNQDAGRTIPAFVSSRQSEGSRDGGEARQRVLFMGKARPLSRRCTERLVSIVMPIKNGASELAVLLPKILEQDADEEIEVVVVDSGSQDGTVGILREFGATLVQIDPADFDHGLTRNLATRHARGDRLVFMNKNSLPLDEFWLRNLLRPLDEDANLAGVCSRVLPRPDADPLAYKDGMNDLSAAPERRVMEIVDPTRYWSLTTHELRAFINFHTVSAAIRRDALMRIPFRSVTAIGEDVLWAKETLEAGGRLQHEPSSVVLHSHTYSYEELFRRHVDDGIANLEIVGRRFDAREIQQFVLGLVRDDWRYLEQQSLTGDELDHWKQVSVLRRVAAGVGQWIGSNSDAETCDLARRFSRIAQSRLETQPSGAV